MYSHLQHFLIWAHFSGKFPHMLMSQPHFEHYYENSDPYRRVFSTFFTYCGKFFCLSHYLYTWLNAIDLPVNTDITFDIHIKAKTQTQFMVLFTSRSLLSWGNLQVTCKASPPRYLPAIYSQQIKFLLLYRDFMMTEFEFFTKREERVEWQHEGPLG